jgi:hypothetical protein
LIEPGCAVAKALAIDSRTGADECFLSMVM